MQNHENLSQLSRAINYHPPHPTLQRTDSVTSILQPFPSTLVQGADVKTEIWFLPGGGRGEEIRPNKSSFLLVSTRIFFLVIYLKVNKNVAETFENMFRFLLDRVFHPQYDCEQRRILWFGSFGMFPVILHFASATIYDLFYLTFDANFSEKELLTNSWKWCNLLQQSSPISDKCPHFWSG